MEFIQSPIFVLNSIYDELILELLVGLDCLPPMDCSQEQTKTFQNYRTVSLTSVRGELSVDLNTSRSMLGVPGTAGSRCERFRWNIC